MVVARVGFESVQASAPGVVDRPGNDAEQTTQADAKQREVSVAGEPAIAELERAIVAATLAGYHTVAALLADRLRACIASGKVIMITRSRG